MTQIDIHDGLKSCNSSTLNELNDEIIQVNDLLDVEAQEMLGI